MIYHRGPVNGVKYPTENFSHLNEIFSAWYHDSNCLIIGKSLLIIFGVCSFVCIWKAMTVLML